jgi:hypothetical protein
MAENAGVEQTATAVRSPLLISTNRPKSPEVSPKALRLRESLVRRLDSSESIPGSADGIYSAEYCSPLNSEDGGYALYTDAAAAYRHPRIDSIVTSQGYKPSSVIEHPGPVKEKEKQTDNLLHPNTLAIGSTPIIYGHGTPLTTIIETKSGANTLNDESSTTTSPIRTLPRIRSFSDLSSSTSASLFQAQSQALLDGQTTLRPQYLASGILRRIESLSDSDAVDSIRLSWPRGYNPHHNTIGIGGNRGGNRDTSEMTSMLHPDIAYATPLDPVAPPIERQPTPPGMPSWTEAQHRRRGPAPTPRRVIRPWGVHGASSLIGRWFRSGSRDSEATPEPDSPATPADHARASGGERRVSGYGIRGPWDAVPPHRRNVSSPILTTPPNMGRFRVPRSGHGVQALEMHPFVRATTIGEMSKDAGNVTPPLQTAQVGVVIAAPAAPIPLRNSSRATGKRKPGMRVRFLASRQSAAVESNTAVETTVPEKRKKECWHRRNQSAPALMMGAVGREMEQVPLTPPYTSIHLPATLVSLTGLRLSTCEPPATSSALNGVQSTPAENPATVGSQAHVPSAVADWNSDPAKERFCWRCEVGRAAEKADELGHRGRKYSYWVCCGRDPEKMGSETA